MCVCMCLLVYACMCECVRVCVSACIIHHNPHSHNTYMTRYIAPDNSQTQSDPAAQSSSQRTPSAFSKMIFITIDNKEITLVLMFTLQTGRHRQHLLLSLSRLDQRCPYPTTHSAYSPYFLMMSKIVEETNRYAEQCLRGTNKQWSTDAEEIQAYFGFMILMGINKLPEIRDYWSTNKHLHYAPIADRISRDRFEEITRYLHFVDNDILPARGEEGFSLLQKVEPVISHLKAKFKSVYYPHCQCSIDEAMIPFKGRSSMKQYLPLKPVKRVGYGRLFEQLSTATGEREGKGSTIVVPVHPWKAPSTVLR